MADEIAPLADWQENGKPAILKYNLAVPSSYTGRTYIDLMVPQSWFTEAAFWRPPEPPEPTDPPPPDDPGADSGSHWWDDALIVDIFGGINLPADLTSPAVTDIPPAVWVDANLPTLVDLVQAALLDVIRTGPTGPTAPGAHFPMNVAAIARIRQLLANPALLSQRVSSVLLSQIHADPLRSLRAALLADSVSQPAVANRGAMPVVALRRLTGERPVVRRLPNGEPHLAFVQQLDAPFPRLFLVERYGLTSFPSDYGAGRVINTMTLLPGEKTTITVKTWKTASTETSVGTSILDSYTQESGAEFTSTLQKEKSQTARDETTQSWYADAEAEAIWSWGSAKAKGGGKGSTTAVREEFVKNMSSATQKHVASASSQRKVEVNTTTQTKEAVGLEQTIVREISNLSVSRTLNFVFRQLNQEFITALHLKDLRIVFSNGFEETYDEVPLHALDDLLSAYLKSSLESGALPDDPPNPRAAVRSGIVDELATYGRQDANGEWQALVVAVPANPDQPDSTYLSIAPIQSPVDAAIGVSVPGIALSVDRYTLPTEGVMAEAMLGHGVALDSYALESQVEALRERRLRNDDLRNRVQEADLALKIVRDGDATRAGLFAEIVKSAKPPADTDNNP